MGDEGGAGWWKNEGELRGQCIEDSLVCGQREENVGVFGEEID